MDEKKVREAIGKLQVGIQGKREKIKFNKAFYPKQDNIQLEEDITVYEIAIEALEKQLPKKPKHIHVNYGKHLWKKNADGSVVAGNTFDDPELLEVE